MKVLKSIFVFFLVVALAGCSKDDGPTAYEFNNNNLTGTYSLTFLESKEVVTEDVNGFDVVTTTITKGDTFQVTFAFAGNEVVKNGQYRIVETVTQNNQTRESSYILDFDNETSSYTVNEIAKRITFDGKTYDVHGFGRTGFQLKYSNTETAPNGDSIVYNEELRFQK